MVFQPVLLVSKQFVNAEDEHKSKTTKKAGKGGGRLVMFHD